MAGCVPSLPQQMTVEMMVHPMYKVADQLDMAGDLLDTNHPMEDVVLNGDGVCATSVGVV